MAIRVAVVELGPLGLTLARLLVASLALAAVAPLLKVRAPARADLPRLEACALTGMAGYQFLIDAGERAVDAGTANLLVNTSPVLAAALAWAPLGTRPRTRVWVGLGFTGASILAIAGGGPRLSLGALLVLGAALAQAVFFVL